MDPGNHGHATPSQQRVLTKMCEGEEEHKVNPSIQTAQKKTDGFVGATEEQNYKNPLHWTKDVRSQWLSGEYSVVSVHFQS